MQPMRRDAQLAFGESSKGELPGVEMSGEFSQGKHPEVCLGIFWGGVLFHG